MKIQKIKICHIAHQLTGKADGVFTHLRMLVELLDKNKYEHIIMYSGNINEINSFFASLNIKVYNIPELNKKFPIMLFIRSYKILKNEQVDIIQPHLVKPYIFSGLLNLFLKKKVVYNYHGTFIENNFYNKVEKILLRVFHIFINIFRLVDVVIVPSFGSKKIIESETNLFKKIIVYHNGFYKSSTPKEVNGSVIDSILKLKQQFFLVGVIGRIDFGKRIDIALNILQKLKQSQMNVFFHFIGDGDLIEQMKDYSIKLDVDDRCQFAGFIPDVKNYLNYYDLILFTSESEGLPLTIWEAMFNEVPIVSSDVGGIKEILEGENCGIVYPFGDVDKCVKIIKEIYNDSNKRQLLGINGKRAIIEKYNENNFTMFFDKLYKGLLNER